MILKTLIGQLNNKKLDLIVFFGGAIGMIIELVGSRVVSPYFGNSLIVWTSLIGVVLGCLSAGYFFGGKLADKTPTYDYLGKILLFGAFALGLSAFFKDLVLQSIQFSFAGDLRAGSFVSVLVLFGPVSVMLGMVAPFSARLRLADLKNSGKTVGNLYALSTFGSITGTFLAGFFLIPTFGNSFLLYGLALGILVLSAITIGGAGNRHVLTGLMIISLFVLSGSSGLFRIEALADIDSLYNRILVKEFIDKDLKRVVGVSTDNAGVQSAIVPDHPDDLYFSYVKAYRASDEVNGQIKKALLIGGGGYSFPRDFLNRHPNSQMDVVEIDPEMTEVARKYFFLKEDPRLKIIHQDARTFINGSKEKYDVIFLDAFNSITPPPHLTTKEFMEKMNGHLSINGFLMINIIASVESYNSLFLRAERDTLLSVFPFVDVYQLDKLPADSIQNLMMIAYKIEPRSELSLGEPLVFLKSKEKILTDDWSPVEFLTRNYY